MTLFELTALFLLLTGALGWMNARWLHLPPATVMTAGGVVGAAALALAARFTPAAWGLGGLGETLRALDFPDAVLGYLLAFLLFAGAMQVDLGELKRRGVAVATLATLGVLASTAIIGVGAWLCAQALALPLSLPWAVVFGALISPTDPVAVLAAVRTGGLSKGLEATLQGEALFNDGVGIVVFAAALAFAAGGGEVSLPQAAGRVALEAAGGGLIGFVGGWFTIRAMRAIDEYAVEVGLTLALAVGAYAIAQRLHVSGPIAVVVAGLMVGESGLKSAMSETTRQYLRGFWTLIDELLTAVLFLLLGLQVLVVRFEPRSAGLWAAAIALTLAARAAVVWPWGAWFRLREGERGAEPLLVWGGLHGALSLALALTIPAGPVRELILATTFAVVAFSVVVQGVSFPRLARRFAATARPEPPERS